MSTPSDALASATLPVVAFDWSFSLVHVTFDGSTVITYATLDDLLDRLATPHRLVGESTFESWDPQRRQAVLARIEASDHHLDVFRPRHTARARKVWGIDKSDVEDVKVIWRLAHHPRFVLHPAGDVDEVWRTRFAELQHDYNAMRLAKAPKAHMAAQAAAVLGPPSALTAVERAVLVGSGKYNPTLLAALWFCAERRLSRTEMERVLGLYGSAYPSLLRSEVHTHSFSRARSRLVEGGHAVTRRAVDDPVGETGTSEPDETTPAAKDWTLYRRVVRQVYRRLFDHLHPPAAAS